MPLSWQSTPKSDLERFRFGGAVLCWTAAMFGLLPRSFAPPSRSFRVDLKNLLNGRTQQTDLSRWRHQPNAKKVPTADIRTLLVFGPEPTLISSLINDCFAPDPAIPTSRSLTVHCPRTLMSSRFVYPVWQRKPSLSLTKVFR